VPAYLNFIKTKENLMLKEIKAIHKAVREDIDDLITYRALPAGDLEMETLNPFIFLNHHGPQDYPGKNNGLPFGPHPHRGIETVTFIVDGELMHKDSSGGVSRITSGGIQWMTAGKGLIHAEVSSDEFKEVGGKLEILQLWLNLPARNKMMDPFYKGLQEESIPEIEDDGGKVKIRVISGSRNDIPGAFDSVSGVYLNQVHLEDGGKMRMGIPPGHVVFFYVVRGRVTVNMYTAEALNLVEFKDEGEEIDITAEEESLIIAGHAAKLKEPITARGPFVMNTYQEIMEAYDDYRSGKFGDGNF
jgi:quercetin 2,3-dioxygenase